MLPRGCARQASSSRLERHESSEAGEEDAELRTHTPKCQQGMKSRGWWTGVRPCVQNNDARVLACLRASVAGGGGARGGVCLLLTPASAQLASRSTLDVTAPDLSPSAISAGKMYTNAEPRIAPPSATTRPRSCAWRRGTLRGAEIRVVCVSGCGWVCCYASSVLLAPQRRGSDLEEEGSSVDECEDGDRGGDVHGALAPVDLEHRQDALTHPHEVQRVAVQMRRGKALGRRRDARSVI